MNIASHVSHLGNESMNITIQIFHAQPNINIFIYFDWNIKHKIQTFVFNISIVFHFFQSMLSLPSCYFQWAHSVDESKYSSLFSLSHQLCYVCHYFSNRNRFEKYFILLLASFNMSVQSSIKKWVFICFYDQIEIFNVWWMLHRILKQFLIMLFNRLISAIMITLSTTMMIKFSALIMSLTTTMIIKFSLVMMHHTLAFQSNRFS